MKLPVKSIVFVIVVVAAGMALIVQKKARLAAEPTPVVSPVVVDVQALASANVRLTQSTIAEVLALRDSVVTAKYGAYVTALPLFEGDRFRRGQVLVKLDTTPIGQQQGSSLTTDVAAAESTYKAEGERLARSRRLQEIGGVSREQLELAEAATAAARARLTLVRENLANATLVAPFDGMVAQRLVQPGDLAAPGKPLLKLVDLSSGVRLVVNLPDGRPPVGLQLGEQILPLAPWPEAAAQGGMRYEARTTAPGYAPGSRVPVKVVLFSGEGIRIPRQCTLDSDGQHATILRVTDRKVEVVQVALVAEGEEGSVTQDRQASGSIACASPDILARLAAGTPFVAGR